ncbi:MAG: YqaA family protein [Myxococcota bacterium]
MTEEPTTPAVDVAPAFDVRRILLKVILGILGLMTVLMGVGYLLREPLMALSHHFVQTLGGAGVAMGFFLPDAFTVPLPNDAFSTFGLVGGLGFWSVVAWASAGSLAGGTVGYTIGLRLRHTPWLRGFMARRGAEVHAMVRRYGAGALAVAALTPLPYSIACWAAGALDMPFARFFAVSLLRIVRVALYLWLIELGIIAVVG